MCLNGWLTQRNCEVEAWISSQWKLHKSHSKPPNRCIFFQMFKRGALATIIVVTKPHMDDCRMWDIFREILSIPQNNVINLNNVMYKWSIPNLYKCPLIEIVF